MPSSTKSKPQRPLRIYPKVSYSASLQAKKLKMQWNRNKAFTINRLLSFFHSSSSTISRILTTIFKQCFLSWELEEEEKVHYNCNILWWVRMLRPTHLLWRMLVYIKILATAAESAEESLPINCSYNLKETATSSAISMGIQQILLLQYFQKCLWKSLRSDSLLLWK